MNSKICYTVCTSNHGHFAKAMITSFRKFNPDYHCVLCFAEKKREPIDFSPFDEVLYFDSLENLNQDLLFTQYNHFELCCASKSFFGNYLMKRNSVEFLLYLDTDIIVYNSFEIAEQALLNESILLTPHVINPMIQKKSYSHEVDFLLSGVFNAGFLMLKKTDISIAFLNWWQERMEKLCFLDISNGLSVDQNWLNFCPALFKNVKVLRDPGYNVAYWNLHERLVTSIQNKFLSNDSPLVFFHLSGFDIQNPTLLSKHSLKYEINDMPLIKAIAYQYKEIVTGFLDRVPEKPRSKKKIKQIINQRINNFFNLFGFELKKINKRRL